MKKMILLVGVMVAVTWCVALAALAQPAAAGSDGPLGPLIEFTLRAGTNQPISAATANALGLGNEKVPAIQIVLGRTNEPLLHFFGISRRDTNDLLMARIDRNTRDGIVWLMSRTAGVRKTVSISTNRSPTVVSNHVHALEFDDELRFFLEFTAPPPWENAPHPLNVVAQAGDLSDVEKVLNRNPNAINEQDDEGMTPLANAIVQEQPDIVRFLLSKGADPNLPTKNGETPLGLAASRDKTNGTALCELLLAKGAWVNPTNSLTFRTTPLDWSITSGNTEVAKLLLDHGASVKATTSNGDTPLHAAADRGDLEIAKMLIAHGADVNAKITGGTTPLHNAAWTGQVEMMKLLLAHGADPDAKRTDGVTPLLHAAGPGAERSGKACVELLLAKGVNVNPTDDNGETALLKAAYYGNKDVVELLLAHGGDVNAASKSGKTALSVATKPEIKDLLRRHGAKE